MKEIELFKHIKDRLGLFVPNSTYDNYVSLIIGYDLAKEHTLLKGFNEWLASKYKLPPNFVFSQQIKYYLFKKEFAKTLTKEDEILLINCLYEKLVEFCLDKALFDSSIPKN
jgi:hypothetical protein